MPAHKGIKSPQQLWENISSTFVNFVENIFYHLGVTIAQKPWCVIITTWIFVLLSCSGILKFHIEKNPLNLWVPPESDFFQDTHWYIDKFGTGFRLQKILIVAENVLEPDVLLTIYNITSAVNNLKVNFKNESATLKDLCYKVPVVNFFTSGGEDDLWDPTVFVDGEFYCSFLETFPMACLEYNILNLWKNDLTSITNTSKHDIITKVNSMKINPITGHPADYTKLLGGVKRDENGDIISASSVLLTWYTQVNMSEIDINEVGNLVGTEDWVSIPLAMWEEAYLDLLKNVGNNITDLNVFYEAGRSFGDISAKSMFQELDKLFMGIALMFFYIIFGLSRFNWLEIKLTLGSVGLLCVGMAYVTAVSWCSIFGISFGPVHSSLPFLLMGLGIDDMFVMNACWNHLAENEKKQRLPVKVGLMLKHAGVSIVITSFTDIVALLIGAITILPSLRSFCIYAAVGVFFIFCFSVTFYVAVFTIDVKRVESKRNGIFFCYQHSKNLQISKTDTIFQKIMAKFYKNLVFSLPGKIFVIVLTVIMTCVSIEAILKLQQRFDPKWFIPEDTYFKSFLNHYEYYYPEEGHRAMVFFGEMNYNAEFPKLYALTHDIKSQKYVLDLDSWVESFQKFLFQRHNKDIINNHSLTDEEFNSYLTKFLYSPVGGRFQINFKFDSPLKCGFPASNITGSSMSFKFPRFNGPEEYIPAMNNLKRMVKSANITSGDGYRSVWSKAFANWVTDEIIGVEVERNIELALTCVMACTVVLITNLQMCFWIFMCVLLTIINVLGWMQRWGMTVDIVCCIGLELAIGLCVDYAAHVGHTFLTTTTGSRAERSFKTVTSIGSAVLLGGGSTLLALSVLSMSQTYTFKSFFKIFLLVILFGLFHGLLFLPVVLSLLGPQPYKSNIENNVELPDTFELNGKKPLEKQLDDS